MSCKQWNDDWVAHVYDELEPDERRALEAHVERCDECRTTLAELRASHAMLEHHAPEVPATPRVVVLRPRPTWSGAWVFAAGAACSLLLFGLGFVTGPRWVEARRAGEPAVAATDLPEPVRSPDLARDDAMPAAHEPTPELLDELSEIRLRLARLEQRPAAEPLPPEEFRAELERLERRVNQERVRDLEHVFRSLTASEMRTGTWMEQTQDALTLLALRQDPRYAER
jgi:hypothetical protein